LCHCVRHVFLVPWSGPLAHCHSESGVCSRNLLFPRMPHTPILRGGGFCSTSCTHVHRPQQLHNHLIRHAQFPGRQSQSLLIPFHHSRSRQFRDSLRETHSILALNPPNLNPLPLPQPQEELLLERHLARNRVDGLHGAHSFRNGRDIR